MAVTQRSSINDILFLAVYLLLSLFAMFTCSVASILTIPVAVLLDWWLRDFILSWQALVGVSAVLLGFAGLTVSEIRETKLQTMEESGIIIHDDSKIKGHFKHEHKLEKIACILVRHIV